MKREKQLTIGANYDTSSELDAALNEHLTSAGYGIANKFTCCRKLKQQSFATIIWDINKTVVEQGKIWFRKLCR